MPSTLGIVSVKLRKREKWKRMLTDRKFLELVYGAASSYVPTTELSEEQLEKLDNITCRWCSCVRCATFKPETTGHANRLTRRIYISKPILKDSLKLTPPGLLMELINTTLHEIVHVLFPDFAEEQTIQKTSEWMKRER